jgi:SAM-dependent methyltransferase
MANHLDIHVAAYQGRNPYDFDNEILLTWYPQRVIRRSPAACSVLELGLGHGYASVSFSRYFARQIVLEGSSAVIANFRGRFPDCQADIREILFEEFDTNERFDVIVMGFILEHVDDPQAIIARYRRFLAPGGRMFVTVPNAETLNRRVGHLAGMLDDLETLSDNDLLLGHKRYYTVDTLRAEMEHGGLRIEGLEGIFLKPITTGQMLALNLDGGIIRALCEVGIAYPELCSGMLAEASLA